MSEHASFSRTRTVRCVCGTSGWGEIAPTDDVAVRHLEFRTGPTGGGAREPVIAGRCVYGTGFSRPRPAFVF